MFEALLVSSQQERVGIGDSVVIEVITADIRQPSGDGGEISSRNYNGHYSQMFWVSNPL